eukprot:scaffold130440_cov48-Phaeocystis_antarctica.AAC.1
MRPMAQLIWSPSKVCPACRAALHPCIPLVGGTAEISCTAHPSCHAICGTLSAAPVPQASAQICAACPDVAPPSSPLPAQPLLRRAM